MFINLTRKLDRCVQRVATDYIETYFYSLDDRCTEVVLKSGGTVRCIETPEDIDRMITPPTEAE